MISKDKQYRTRDGQDVRIYATDGQKPYEIHGAYYDGKNWIAETWKPNGDYSGEPNDFDLIELKPRIKREYWISIYDTFAMLHRSEQQAKQYNLRDAPSACVKVVIDCEKGEGL